MISFDDFQLKISLFHTKHGRAGSFSSLRSRVLLWRVSKHKKIQISKYVNYDYLSVSTFAKAPLQVYSMLRACTLEEPKKK